MPRPQILSLPERLDAHPDYLGRGVCIAFIDVGFYPHPDLLEPRRRIRAYADVAQAAPRLPDFHTPSAASWHGTMTACAAIGSGYRSGGRYRGLASESEAVLIRAGDKGRVLGKNVASALRFALRHPELEIKLVSVSLGVSPGDPDAGDVDDAVAELTDAGIAVFVAAGNDPGRLPEPPATARQAITLGGWNDQNTLAPGDDTPWPSSHGEVAPGCFKPDLLAPAVWLPAPMIPGTLVAREAVPLFHVLGVLEELAAERAFLSEQGGEPMAPEDDSFSLLERAVAARLAHRKYISPDYQHVDGTSFAAPIAASVAAQMLEANPSLGPSQLRKGLLSTAEPVPALASERQGAGVLRARAAVDWALERRGR